MAMTASQAQMANDLEIEMMQDLYMKYVYIQDMIFYFLMHYKNIWQ